MLSAYEDGAHEWEDAALLDRAQALARVLFSRDDDLLREATRRQRERILFDGVIYAHQREVSIGRCTLDLHLPADASEPEELRDRVIFLPLLTTRVDIAEVSLARTARRTILIQTAGDIASFLGYPIASGLVMSR